MVERNRTSLNQLLPQLAAGQMVDSAWLQAQGISRPSIHQYVARGWLERVAPRVYRRATSGSASRMLRWEAAILSAQQLRPASFYLGGLTVLELLGRGHYLRLGTERQVHLYDPDGDAPSWLIALPLAVELLVHKRKLFATPHLGLEWRRMDLGTGRLGAAVPAPEQTEPWDHFIRVAGEERATIEALDDIPDSLSFDHADRLFEGLTTLRPQVLATLLESCTSVRAKRLFLFFADRHGHAWSKHVDRTSIDLGRGKRQLVPGGKLDTRYLITVPASFVMTGQRASA